MEPDAQTSLQAVDMNFKCVMMHECSSIQSVTWSLLIHVQAVFQYLVPMLIA
jgi:hypothetical protein